MAHKAKKLKDDDDDDDDENSRFVNKALPVKVVAVGDDYEKIRMAITAFRMLFRRMDGITALAQAATTTFVPRVVKRKPKKPKNKKEAREEVEKQAKIAAANEAAKEFLGVDIDPARIRRLVVDWMGGTMGKGAYYELRNVFFVRCLKSCIQRLVDVFYSIPPCLTSCEDGLSLSGARSLHAGMAARYHATYSKLPVSAIWFQ